MNIRIDPEFKDYLGALDEEARQSLEASIKAEGCRDALVVWPQPDHGAILLDGHNRLEICERLGIAYRTINCPDSVIDRLGAAVWIVKNQQGRRNVTQDELRYICGKVYQSEKKARGRPGADHGEGKSVQNEHFSKTGKTEERVGSEFGFSPATVRRNEKFAEQVDAIAAKHGPEAKAEILARRKKVEDYIPSEPKTVKVTKPDPEPTAEEETPPAPASESETSSTAPSVGEQSSASALPEGDPLRGWSKQSESDHVQWLIKNVPASGDHGLKPGPVDISDTGSENLVDPEKAERFANSYMNHLCQIEHHAIMLPSAIKREAPDAERREMLKTKLARLVDALQTIVASL